MRSNKNVLATNCGVQSPPGDILCIQNKAPNSWSHLIRRKPPQVLERANWSSQIRFHHKMTLATTPHRSGSSTPGSSVSFLVLHPPSHPTAYSSDAPNQHAIGEEGALHNFDLIEILSIGHRRLSPPAPHGLWLHTLYLVGHQSSPIVCYALVNFCIISLDRKRIFGPAGAHIISAGALFLSGSKHLAPF